MPGANSARAAVPSYVGSGFNEAPPGHRYRLYFQYWDQDWRPPREAKLEALQNVVSFPRPAQEQLRGILERQETLAKAVYAHRITAISTSPFTTGLGIEHPMENGFAFLDPYGLPYLPGSSVKGVVRRAAEELALFENDPKGWTIPAVWWLFGFDGSSAYLESAKKGDPEFVRQENERWKSAFSRKTRNDNELLLVLWDKIKHQIPREEDVKLEILCSRLQESQKLRRSIHLKGSLDFWDVVPKPPKDELRVDIMNPHYTHYYQKGDPPGDWGSPTPIFFLTLPPETAFSFHIRLLTKTSLPSWFLQEDGGRPHWQILVESALAFAFEWLGFGAKTAVGYGRMRTADSHVQAQPEKSSSEMETALGDSLRDHTGKPPVADAKSSLAKLRERVLAMNPKDRSELDEMVNILGRNRTDPLAPEIAKMVWEKVRHLDFQANRLKKNTVFMDLVNKGGGREIRRV